MLDLDYRINKSLHFDSIRSFSIQLNNAGFKLKSFVSRYL